MGGPYQEGLPSTQVALPPPGMRTFQTGGRGHDLPPARKETPG